MVASWLCVCLVCLSASPCICASALAAPLADAGDNALEFPRTLDARTLGASRSIAASPAPCGGNAQRPSRGPSGEIHRIFRRGRAFASIACSPSSRECMNSRVHEADLAASRAGGRGGAGRACVPWAGAELPCVGKCPFVWRRPQTHELSHAREATAALHPRTRHDSAVQGATVSGLLMCKAHEVDTRD